MSKSRLHMMASMLAGGGDTPQPSVLPDGYTECEWVQPSNPTSSINTSVSPNSTWELDLKHDSTPSANQIIIARQSSYANWAAACKNGKWGLGTASNQYTGYNVTTRCTMTIEFTSSYTTMTIGNSVVKRTDIGNVTKTNIKLFGYDSSYLYKGKIYGAKCTAGGTFNGIPAKRDSDDSYGIYDIANNVFYKGTGYTGQIKSTT